MSAHLLASSDFGLSYILEIVGVVVIIAILARKVAPLANRAMNAKIDSIRGQLSAGEQAKIDAEALIEERRKLLTDATREAEAIVSQAKESAARLVEDGRRRADEERTRLIARVDQEIEVARLVVRAEISNTMVDAIVVAAEKVVDAELDRSVHHRLIGEAIRATGNEAANE